MSSIDEKHEKVVEEAVARIISRAENSRALQSDDLFKRVVKSLDKYVFKFDENASALEIKEFHRRNSGGRFVFDRRV